LHRLNNKWVMAAVALFVAGLIPLVWYWPAVSRYDNARPPEEPHQAGIVLGAALWDGKPSPALKERLEMALSLYRQGKVKYLIVSGGPESDRITEAEVMKRYLTARGVPDDRILKEDRSTNTKENLLYSKKILKDKNWTRVTIITHDYHMYRAINYARQAGMEPSASPVHSEVLFTPYHKARECLALIKQQVLKT
jgi:uncharacterized SAM-binding protein YcdF (DUF218 family)